jgi:hypothetical protein
MNMRNRVSICTLIIGLICQSTQVAYQIARFVIEKGGVAKALDTLAR